MRLFVAISLPDHVKEQLRDIQKPIEGMRWQNANQYHLTLRFIGEVGEQRVEKIEEKLSAVQVQPFHIQINRLGYFSKKGVPKIIWAGIKENENLLELQHQIEQACQAAGLKPDHRPYKPHITLGKNKHAPRHKLLSYIKEHRSFHIDNIPVESFVLYTSTLTPGGAIHQPRKTYSLPERA